MRRLALHHSHLTVFSKMRKSCFPREGSGGSKRVLARSMSALLTRSRLSRHGLPGLLLPQPGFGVGGPDDLSLVPGVPDPGVAPLETPQDARPGRMSRAAPLPPSLVLPSHPPLVQRGRSGYPSWQRGRRRGREKTGGVGGQAPKLQTAQLQLQVSGLSLEAIINLRFIFIGELESRLTLAKQGSSSRPWMRLNAGEYFGRKALQARLLCICFSDFIYSQREGRFRTSARPALSLHAGSCLSAELVQNATWEAEATGGPGKGRGRAGWGGGSPNPQTTRRR